MEKSLAELSQEIEIIETADDDTLHESDSEAPEGDDVELEGAEKQKVREASLQQLQSNISSSSLSNRGKRKVLEIDSCARPCSQAVRHTKHTPDAVIVLKEEKVICVGINITFDTDMY